VHGVVPSNRLRNIGWIWSTSWLHNDIAVDIYIHHFGVEWGGWMEDDAVKHHDQAAIGTWRHWCSRKVVLPAPPFAQVSRLACRGRGTYAHTGTPVAWGASEETAGNLQVNGLRQRRQRQIVALAQSRLVTGGEHIAGVRKLGLLRILRSRLDIQITVLSQRRQIPRFFSKRSPYCSPVLKTGCLVAYRVWNTWPTLRLRHIT